MKPKSRDIVKAELTQAISAWESDRNSIRLLEAGGGSMIRVPLSLVPTVTVVDISEEQLERNPAAEKILGDLHHVDLGEQRFDIAVAWDVIEHLDDPWLVVQKLIKAVKPGGIIVLAAPNRNSLSGLVTRLSPHSFHVWVYRHIFKRADAGEPGRAPFPTVHHSDIDPATLQGKAVASGVGVLYAASYERSTRQKLKKKTKLLGIGYDLVAWVGSNLTGKNMLESDFILVLQKTANDVESRQEARAA